MGKESDNGLAVPKRARRVKERKEADYKLIREYYEQKGWSISVMCQILEISRAAYYKWLHRKPSKAEESDKELLGQIKAIADKNNRLFGYRKMTMSLTKGEKGTLNHKRVYRLMCLYDLDSVYRRKKRRWKRSEPAVTAENKMGRDFNADAPNEKWGTDITELKWPGITGKVYISTILDHYDRYPVAVVVSRRNDTALTDQTLKIALKKNPEGVKLFHSDRGFQYTRAVYQNRLIKAGALSSMSRAGCCIDNAAVECFQGQIKDMLEILHPEVKTYEQLEAAIYATYDYYCNEYPQERFHGKTSGQVRAEALTAEVPVSYPIKINLGIQRWWQMINEKQTART